MLELIFLLETALQNQSIQGHAKACASLTQGT